MPRRDKDRLKLAGRIRESRNKQKESGYTRPEGWKKKEESRQGRGGFTGYSDSDMKDMNESMKKYWNKKKKKKAKKGILGKISGGEE